MKYSPENRTWQTGEYWVADGRWITDSAEVTSSGRSFHVRGPTTGKARLVGDGCQLDRRHWQTAGASRTERSAARQVGDIVERVKVWWRKSVQEIELISVCVKTFSSRYIDASRAIDGAVLLTHHNVA